MSARDDLLCITAFGATSAELAERRIDAYRAEVLREAAAAIQKMSADSYEDTASALGPNYSVISALHAASKLINPDTP